jgi:hypothetical protein
MKSRKFPSFNEAKEYLNSSGGEVKYHGVIGYNEYYCYTLTIGAIVYHVDIYPDGRLEVNHTRYKRSDE